MADRPCFLDCAIYFITFTTYGARLHGDDRGTVDRTHNTVGEAARGEHPNLRDKMAASLKARPFTIGPRERRTISLAIHEICNTRGWQLQALNVRSTHIHVLVLAEHPIERVMNDFKTIASRRLRERGLVERGRPVWARHGSTKYLKTAEAAAAARDYVVNRQGADLPGAMRQPDDPDTIWAVIG